MYDFHESISKGHKEMNEELLKTSKSMSLKEKVTLSGFISIAINKISSTNVYLLYLVNLDRFIAKNSVHSRHRLIL